MGPAWSRSPSTRRSTAFRCFRPMAGTSSSRRTAWPRPREKRMCSLPTGSTEAGRLDFLFLFGLGLDLPVGQRLGSGTDVGDVGIDACRKIGAFVGALGAIGETGRLVIALRNAGLLALSLVGGWS